MREGRIRRLWIIIMLMIAVLSGSLFFEGRAYAADLTYGDYNYVILGDDTVEITKYTGSATDLIIPERIDGKLVTKIGNYAFEKCSGLKTVVVPSGVTHIGSWAFNVCKELTDVVLPSGLTSIGNCAFYCCYALTHINLPSGITRIEKDTFRCCQKLTDLTFPSGLTSIGESAFYGCGSLTRLDLPSGLTSIEEDAFDGCDGVESVKIPSGITRIESYTFKNCYKLSEVEFPSTLKSIGGEAFYNCNLTDVRIPSGVTGIGGGAFERCFNLVNIDLPPRMESLGSAFENCKKLTDIVIPTGVTWIYCDTFYNCGALKTMQIPLSLTGFDSFNFTYCYDLKDIYYEGSEEDWKNVKGVNIPTTYTVHFNCRSPKGMEQLASNYATDGGVWGDKSSASCYWNLFKEDETDTATLSVFGRGSMPLGIFVAINLTPLEYGYEHPWEKYNSKITRFFIDTGFTEISNIDFSKMSNLTAVEIPRSVKKISENPFQKCSKLKEIRYQGTEAEWNAIAKGDMTLPAGTTIVYDYQGDWTEYKTGLVSDVDDKRITIDGKTYLYASYLELDKENYTVFLTTHRRVGLKGCTVNYKTDKNNIIPVLYLKGKSDSTNFGGKTSSGSSGIVPGPGNTETDKAKRVFYYGYQYKTSMDEYVRLLKKKLEKENKKESKAGYEIYMDADQKAQADQMMITFDPLFETNKKGKIAVYKAYAEFIREMADKSGVDLGKVDVSSLDPTKISVKIVNNVRKALKSYHHKGTYDQYTVEINMAGISVSSNLNAVGGTVSVTCPNGRRYSNAASIISTTDVLNHALSIYVENMTATANETVRTAIKKTIADLGKVSGISDLIIDMESSSLEKTYDALNAIGFGKVYKVLRVAKQSYTDLNGLLTPRTNGSYATQLLDNWEKKPEELFKAVSIVNYSEDEIKDDAIKTAVEKMNNKAKQLGQALIDYYEGDKGISDKTIKKYREIFVKCPVNVVIKDSTDTVLASYINGSVYETDQASVEVAGDKKILRYASDLDVRVEITATEDGVLEYVIREFDANGLLENSMIYDEMPLETGQSYTQSVPVSCDMTDQQAIPLIDWNNNAIYASEVFRTDEKKYEIRVEAEEGGTATGDGTYVEGDIAMLSASVENDSYVFDGWYVDDVLVEAGASYPHSVKEDITVKAKFSKRVQDYDAYTVEISKKYEGSGVRVSKTENGNISIFFSAYKVGAEAKLKGMTCKSLGKNMGKLAYEAGEYCGEFTGVTAKDPQKIILQDADGDRFCTLTSKSYRKLTGIKLDRKTATIAVGKKISLKATLSPAKATNTTLKWTSSNSKVAKVSGGKVTGVAAGTAVIKAIGEDGDVVASCKISVKKVGKVKKGKKYYYYSTNAASLGKLMKGWIKVGKKKYYADPKTGVLKAGRVKIKNKYYYFSKNSKTYGELQTGWIKVGKKKLYAKKTGVLKTGWAKINKKYYYFSKKAKNYGVMQTGKVKIGKKIYRFNKAGVCLDRK